jgi:hypothetical protein
MLRNSATVVRASATLVRSSFTWAPWRASFAADASRSRTSLTSVRCASRSARFRAAVGSVESSFNGSA